MSLDDWYQEQKAIDEMNKAHAEQERTQEYCMKCGQWHSRFLPHYCKEDNDGQLPEGTTELS